jgi:hypothetical protein
MQNIEMWKSDLISLMEDGVKIQSVAVNAYGAALQENAGVDGDFIIFSSWLPQLAADSRCCKNLELTYETSRVEDLAKIKDSQRQDARDPKH